MIEPRDVHEMIFRMTMPARRHRCPECQDIFECHLCEIYDTHPLHIESSDCPFLCVDCALKLGIETVAVNDTDTQQLKLYDYRTGQRTEYAVVRGWATEGRSDSDLGRFCTWLRDKFLNLSQK